VKLGQLEEAREEALQRRTGRPPKVDGNKSAPIGADLTPRGHARSDARVAFEIGVGSSTVHRVAYLADHAPGAKD
jgi:hypothetical protein